MKMSESQICYARVSAAYRRINSARMHPIAHISRALLYVPQHKITSGARYHRVAYNYTEILAQAAQKSAISQSLPHTPSDFLASFVWKSLCLSTINFSRISIRELTPLRSVGGQEEVESPLTTLARPKSHILLFISFGTIEDYTRERLPLDRNLH